MQIMTHCSLAFPNSQGGNVISPSSFWEGFATMDERNLCWLRDYHSRLPRDLARDPVNQTACFHTVDQINQ